MCGYRAFNRADDGMYDMETNVVTPIFATGYIQSTWYLIVAFGLLGIGRECVKLIDGTYTKRVLVVTAVADALSVVLAVIWLGNPAIINPEFDSAVAGIFADVETFIYSLMEKFNYFFLACIILALVVDLAIAAWKYYNTQK